MLKRLSLLIVTLIIASCSTPTGVPGKGATPKEEPLSPSGNPESYEVFGTTYRILPTSRGYREVGYASWYGKDFHGKRTSSGTPYNMYAYSAAHKTLPIPTYVKVTNLENGRSLVLRVDDRGPFVKNRIIDLSYTAAKELDLIQKGTAKVEVVALPPYQHLKNPKAHPTEQAIQTPPSAPNTAVEGGRYYVQLGSFKERGNAEAFMNTMAATLGRPTEVHYSRGLHRVVIGSYATHNEAKAAAERLHYPNTVITL